MEVPRERFLPDDLRMLAYSDVDLKLPPEVPGEEVRTLLTPMVLARMIQGARLKPTERVLDVACGTGYSTAIIAGLAGEVIALESGPARRRALQRRLAACGLERVRTLDGGLAEGADTDGPFDVILINGAASTNLEALLAQLAEGGRLHRHPPCARRPDRARREGDLLREARHGDRQPLPVRHVGTVAAGIRPRADLHILTASVDR